MPPLPASRCRYGCTTSNSGCRRSITQGGAAFTAESFAGLVGSAALGTQGGERYAATRTEFASLPIIAATFGTTHIAPLWLRWFGPVKAVLSVSSYPGHHGHI